MKIRLIASMAMIVLAAAPTLVSAAPPTVTPSPGYDRRLQESRSATTNPPITVAPVNPPATVRKPKKKHVN
jgi:hypothetical protein